MQRSVGILLGCVCLLFLPLAILAPKGIALLFTIGCLTLLLHSYLHQREYFRIHHLGWSLLGFLMLAVISSTWSMTPVRTLKTSIFIGLIFFAGQMLLNYLFHQDKFSEKIIENGIFLGGIIGFAFLGFDIVTGGILIKFVFGLVGKPIAPHWEGVKMYLKPGFSICALYFWPWAFLVHRKFSLPVTIALVSAAMLVIIAGGANTSIGAIILGLVAFSMTLILHKNSKVIFLTVLLLGIVAMPLLPGYLPDPFVAGKNLSFLSNSAIHRVAIWQKSAYHISQNPIIGYGFDTSRSLYQSDSKANRPFFPDIPERRWIPNFEPIPLHPHNLVLQVWLELGLVGASMLAIILSIIVRSINLVENDWLKVATAYGIMTSSLVVAVIGFGAWQTWWLSSLFLIGGISVKVLRISR